jgi:hypothetical protein
LSASLPTWEEPPLRSQRLVVTALALIATLTLLFSHAAFATAAPEPSATIASGGTASFTIAGFSLSSSRPAPASVQVATNPAALANGSTWRNIVYYAVDWGMISSDPAQVQAALWYVSSGVWPAGDHSVAQRLVDTARSSATPASTANGYDLLFAISGGRASATASFSSGSGSVTVTNLQSMPLTVYLSYGTILVGPDNLPAYVVYAIGGNPPAQATATQSAAQATVTQVAGLPTAQPTASGGAQPSATSTRAASGQLTATVTATLMPKPTMSPDGAGLPATPTTPPSVSNPSSAASLPTATAMPAPPTGPPTATAQPTNLQPQTSLPAGQPAPLVSKPAVQSASGQPHIAPAPPTPIPTAEDAFASPIPTEDSGLPTEVPTFIYPTFTPRPSVTPGGPALTAIPSATSVFPPTATSAPSAATTTGNPTPAAPTKPPLAASTATLPTLPNEAPLNATPPPPGPSQDGSGTAGGAATSGSASGSVSNPATAPSSVAPKTGEQSPLPLYLLVGGLAALVAGVVVIQLNNRRAKK